MASSGSGNPVISAALARMAVLRQADVSEMTLDIFTAEIAAEGLPVECVLDACDELAHRERAEGETAFPSFATLLRECHAAEHRRHQARQRALAAEGEQFLQAAQPIDPAFTRAEAKVVMGAFHQAVAARRALAAAQVGQPETEEAPS